MLGFAQRLGRHGPANDGSQLGRGRDRVILAATDDLLADPAGIAFFTIILDDPDQLLFTVCIDQIGSSRAAGLVHSHVQWAFLHVGKTALSLVQLPR